MFITNHNFIEPEVVNISLKLFKVLAQKIIKNEFILPGQTPKTETDLKKLGQNPKIGTGP